MRIFFIPDIHGRLDLLRDIMDQLHHACPGGPIDFDKGDKLIFGGDYIDRGPDSRGVLEFVKKLTEIEPKNIIALAGNHEWLMIDALTKGGYDNNLWLSNGGGETLKSYDYKVPDETVKWLASLPLSHEEPGFFFSHAPVPAESRRLAMNRGQPYTKRELIWTYDPDEKNLAYEFSDKIGVCGHIHDLSRQLSKGRPLSPRFYKHYIFADAGAGCHPKAPLVAIEVVSREVLYAWPIDAQTTQA